MLSSLAHVRSAIARQATVAAAATDDPRMPVESDEHRSLRHLGGTVASDDPNPEPICPAIELPALARHGSAPRAARTNRACILHNNLKLLWMQGLAAGELAQHAQRPQNAVLLGRR